MSKPLFAPKWFKDVPAAELRQEIQNLYRLVAQLKGETGESLAELDANLSDLGADVTALEDFQQSVWYTGNLPLEPVAWTPRLESTGTQPSVTHEDQVGYYVRIGPRLVWVHLRVRTSARSGGTGVITIRGFPFAMTDMSNGTAGVLAVESSNINYGTGTRTLTGRATSSDNGFRLVTNPSNGGHAYLSIDDWNASGHVAMTGTVLIEPGQ